MTGSVKPMILGFLPIAVYLVMEAIYGVKIGLFTALVFGCLEMAYRYIKEKIVSKIILFDLGVIGVLSVFSLPSENTFITRLTPIAFEVICILLLFLVFQKPKRMQLYFERFKLPFLEEHVYLLRKNIRRFIWVLAIHSLILIIATFYGAESHVAFVSGTLLYGTIIFLFVYQIFELKLKSIWWNVRYPNDEWLPIVNMNGNVLYHAPRTVAHTSPEYLHPTVHMLFVKNGNVYLQKRAADKQIFPGYWDSSVGGHVAKGESIEEALKKECLEELGVNKFNYQFIQTYLIEDEGQRELVYFFLGETPEKISPNSNEVEEGRYWSLTDINLNPVLFTPHLLNKELPLLNQSFKV